MKEALAEINALRAAGVIGEWAIGGAMGATFYLEPVSTFDLDVFVIFENPGLILTLTPIYDFLQNRGYSPEGEAIVVGRWPIQFLAAESSLLREAVDAAKEIDFEGVPARVMAAEHLMAIALQTGRGKDIERMKLFVESGKADNSFLNAIMGRHHLESAWKEFSHRHLPPA